AVRLELIERPAEVAGRGERARDSLEHREVGLLEVERPLDGRVARLVAIPRPEAALGLDFTRRHAVGQRRLEWPGIGGSEPVHAQVVNRPDLGRLPRFAGDDDQARVVGVDAIEDDAAHLERVFTFFFRGRLRLRVGGLGLFDRLFLLNANLLRRDVDVEAVELYVIDVLAPQAQQARVDVKGLHRDERWDVRRRAASPDFQIGAVGAQAG